MPTAKKAAAKTDALKLLKADHAEVSEMFDKYENGRLPKARKAALAQKICAALTVHAQIEEEIFYPAAREAGGKEVEDMLNEAEVEHGSIKELVAALEAGSPEDELFDAQVKVVSEWVKHHVKEEEGELFPKIRKSDMDLEEVGEQLAARKTELTREMKAAA
ncbi:MAG TPA: hemerythrin domain-containing protein [Dongiaceae bacterium]|nr:hemerythrin domain-containing protein [Dongiaceae bacterium]